MEAPKIRPAEARDRITLAAMRAQLWPDASHDEHLSEIDTLLDTRTCGGFPIVLLVAEHSGGSLIGFLEGGMRSHADGCDPARPVGYAEGWFVEEAFRKAGVGKQLMSAAEDWARAQGCREMASDTWIDAVISQRAHEALGFEVVDRCVNYRKTL